MATSDELERVRAQGQAQLESIKELVAALDTEDEDGLDAAREAIVEDALGVEVRKEYIVLLCWGGPAARIRGELSEHGEPETALLEYQDWFMPWTELPLSPEDAEAVLTYASQFYFEVEGV